MSAMQVDESRVRTAFENNFLRNGERGAAVSVWQGEEEIISLSQGVLNQETGQTWQHDTLVLIWSATKGLASGSALHALEKNGKKLDDTVAGIWPEFAQNGKEAITLRQLFSHQSGLSALSDAKLSLMDYDGVIAAIESQSPRWNSGEGHGYGPRTYGFLMDEIVRRLTGAKLGDYWRVTFGEPLALDTWIGLPAEYHARVAPIFAPRNVPCADGTDPFLEAMADPQSLTRAAFASPAGVLGASAMNSPVVRSASIPSLGGISSASSLAKFYAMLANDGSWNGTRFFEKNTLAEMQNTIVQGCDKILCVETAFAAGFMKDPVDEEGKKRRMHFGPSLSTFGHPGAGGSLAFADPENKIGFAYVMSQMVQGTLPSKKALGLVDAVYAM